MVAEFVLLLWQMELEAPHSHHCSCPLHLFIRVLNALVLMAQTWAVIFLKEPHYDVAGAIIRVFLVCWWGKLVCFGGLEVQFVVHKP